MKNLPSYRAFCPLLLGLCLFVGCGGPSDDELRPVVLVTLRGISSDITTLRVKALINGAPAMNTQEYQEGLGSADVSEYRFTVRAPVLRAPGRLELSIWSLTADGCFLSENQKESAQVEPAQFQELIIDLHRFEKVMCPLTVQRQGGPGLVHFDPERPVCADTCTELVPRDQTVTLIADGNRQTSLQQWEGDCSGQSTCQVKLSSPKQVTARFMQTLRVVPTWSSSEPGAALITSDVDANDKPFLTGKRTVEGFHETKMGIEQAISRGLAYAPYADLVWCETSTPDLAQAKRFAEAIHARHPGKLLAYNCSPSFNWKKNLDDATIAKFQKEIASYGYKFQFITLAGFHALNYGMWHLATGYRERQMAAYVELQQAEFAAEPRGYTGAKHQREVGTGYFDKVNEVIAAGQSSLSALAGSTEEEQFHGDAAQKSAA